MPNQVDSPGINIAEEQLRLAGFTDSGIPRFKETIKGYVDMLFERAIHYGDVDKAPNLQHEITHEHVRAAAFSIARSYGKPVKPKWVILAKIGEYIAAAITGIGSGHLNKELGIVAFGLGLSIFVILIVIRLTKTKSEE